MLHRLARLLALVLALMLVAGLSPFLPAASAAGPGVEPIAKDPAPEVTEPPALPPPAVPERSSEEAAAKDSFDPATSVVVARTEKADTYKNTDRTSTLVLHGAPANYRDAAGNWKRLDANLKPGKAAKAGRHVAAEGPVTTEVADSADDSSLVSLSGPGWSASWSMAGAAKSKAKVSGPKATFTNVNPGVDVEELVTGTGVKETIVLHMAPKAAEAVSWRFPLRLSGLTTRVAGDGSISFADNTGEIVLRIPPGVAVDSSTTPRMPFPASTPVRLVLEGSGANLVLVASVDRAWLVDPARKYPVRVDPSFDAGNDTGRSDAYASSYCPSCTYNGSAQWDGSNYLNAIGYTTYSWSEYATYLNFDVWPVLDKRVLSAQLRFYTLAKAGANNAVSIYPLAAPFSQDNVNWYNRPNHYADTIAVNPPVGNWASVDMTSWAAKWADRSWGAHGLTMDTGGRNELVVITAAESAYQGTAPAIYITYNDPPPISNPISPAGGAMVTTTQPSLSTTPVADPEGNAVEYFFRVRDVATGALASDSGWATSTNRAVPAGRLSYGRSYRWETWTWDGLHPVAIGPSAPASFQIASEVTGAPTTVVATRGDTTASVAWSAPSFSVPGLTTYTVGTYRAGDNALVGSTSAGTSTSTTVAGLKNGTAYYFKVKATNIVLASTESAPSNTIVPAGVPFAPTGVVGTRGDSSATVRWSPPGPRQDGTPGDNGAAITSYIVTASPGGAIFSSSSTSVLVTGLRNASTYTFEVRGVNSAGEGQTSDSSPSVVPAGKPFPPVVLTVVRGDRAAAIVWEPPVARADGTPGENGAPITSYTVRSSPGALVETVNGAERTATVSGLANGTAYTFTVSATNAVGTSDESAQSSQITPAGAPSTPTNVVATPRYGYATVRWDPSDSNGALVTYFVVASPGGATRSTTGTSVLIPELANGQPYTFVVTAQNSAGTAAPSEPSSPVTP